MSLIIFFIVNAVLGILGASIGGYAYSKYAHRRYGMTPTKQSRKELLEDILDTDADDIIMGAFGLIIFLIVAAALGALVLLVALVYAGLVWAHKNMTN